MSQLRDPLPWNPYHSGHFLEAEVVVAGSSWWMVCLVGWHRDCWASAVEQEVKREDRT